ncbi:MAG: oligosaccharide flippase family protein [Candidatus Marinimicrobia bacterium]|nr:oligosaccharide flippase family protein [Candidatus Neomarinimicrobiota bacterium]MCF7827906.1 oligosaccharide flippase family protein [Candidatus Neomarinimicrobiota bacterium]MCF7879339.1 oligosaccharide flippase family protein [Candidatus Neomarinimicrobiota bacterium]
MFDQLKKLFTDSVIYGVGYIATRVITFLLLPFYTNTLTKEEYGIIALGFFFAGFAKIVYRYGTDSALIRNYELAEEPENKRLIFSTGFWSVSGTSLILSLLILLAANPIASALFETTELSLIIVLLAGIILLDTLNVLPQTLLRIREQPVYYVFVSFVNVTVTLGLNIYLVGYLQMGVVGVFIANIIASSAMFVTLTPVLFRELTPRFSKERWLALFKFGLPLIPAGIGSMIMELIDRPILKELTDVATVGLYSAGYKLGIFMMLVVSAFYFAWQPFFMKAGQQENGPEIFSRVFTYFMFILCGLFIGLTFLLEYLVRIPLPGMGTLLGPDFLSATIIVPIIFAAYIMYGAYINFLPGIYLKNKSGKLAIYTGVGAIANIAGNFLLIPSLGITGAALATFLGYAVMAVLLYRANRTLYPIPYQWRKVATTFGITVVLVGIYYLTDLSLSVRILMILAYVVLHFVFGFVRMSELKQLAGRFKRVSA